MRIVGVQHMTRIEVPIPQPEPEQPDLAFEFVEGKNGLLEFHAESLEAHVAAFRKVNEGIDDHFWSQGAIAASLTKKHGEKGEAIDKMAEAVELSSNHLRKLARTWRTFQFVPRDPQLNFTIHKAACRHPNPAEALATAKSQGMSKDTLNKWITEQALRRADRATRKARSATRTAWRDHLLHMDSVIASDFIKNSPNQEYARRVCGEWRTDIADELKDLELAEHREKVIAAIDDRGAENVKAIRKLIGLPAGQIEAIVSQMVEENLYEWIRKHPLGRGQPEFILHKVGEPIGGRYN
jgi:hypothetical protein